MYFQAYNHDHIGVHSYSIIIYLTFSYLHRHAYRKFFQVDMVFVFQM